MYMVLQNRLQGKKDIYPILKAIKYTYFEICDKIWNSLNLFRRLTCDVVT